MTKTVVNFLGEELTPVLNRYVNGQTAIQLLDQDGAPFMMASVAHDVNIDNDCVIIKNYSENEGIMEALIEAGIIEKPFCEIPTGFVTLYVAELCDIDLTLDQRI
jgi:hypothetical protein|tara:strand:- start:16 stop:330 length:315 start_codon:yes stop_codon:yes gene_type:complete